MDYKIGILSFGSLINDPGNEIAEASVDIIDCVTPFKVEYARISSSRSNAPTLIPVDENAIGKKVKAKIIKLRDGVTTNQAKDMLWRRECYKIGSSKGYKESSHPTSKNLQIKTLDNFLNFRQVIYTYFSSQDEFINLTPKDLACFAISSILSEAGNKEKDGIRYLLSAKNNGIKTELSDDYESFILMMTDSNNLAEAIEKMDRKRKMYP